MNAHCRTPFVGAIDFQYDPSWLAWEHALPVSLSLLCVRDRYIGAAVVAVSDNLLPDSMPIRHRMAERVHAQGIDAYDLLTGADGTASAHCNSCRTASNPGAAGAVDGRPVDDENRPASRRPLHRLSLSLVRTRTFGSRSPAPRKRPRACSGKGVGTSRWRLQPRRTFSNRGLTDYRTASIFPTASRMSSSAS